jgi:hypothetical protein
MSFPIRQWRPFIVTAVCASCAAAALFIWKGSQIQKLEAEVKAPVIGLTSSNADKAPRPATGKKSTGPAQAKLDAKQRPTRNGMRSLFERAKNILDMDREELEELLAELETGKRIRSPISGITLMAAYARLAELDPAGAMARVMQQKGENRDIGMFTVMNEWLAKDRQGALAWFAQSGDMDAKKQYLTIASFTNAGSDPELIEQLSASINDPEARSKALLDSISALAFTDPDAAFKKLAEIEDPDEREKAEERVYQGYLMRYPDKALDFALSQPAGSKARENMRNSLVQWGEQDPEAALKWMTSQSKDVQKELFDTGDGKGPGWGFGRATVEQINAAARQLPDQAQQDKLHAAWANSQSHSNPVNGLNQLSSIRDPELQKATASSIGGALAQNGRTSDMTRWLETAQPNDSRDAAVAAFARGIARNDPAAGSEWAGRITNAAMRQETVEALKNPAPAPPVQNYGPGRRR